MALSFDDLFEAEGSMSVPLDLEVPNSVFELDNSSCDVIQAGMTKDAWPKKSPFHESDSGMSEDFCSVGSPESVNLFERQDSGKMLDDLVDSLDIEPFCNGSEHGSDQDLVNYLGCKISEDDTENDISKQLLGDGMLNRQMSVSDESAPGSPEVPQRVLRSKNVKSLLNTGASAFKTVQPQTTYKPVASVSISEKPAVPSVKVLKVIKTSGTANTATEVLKALDERNKKNAVQAKVNREKKKQYIKSLEDEVSALESRNGKLQTENESMKQRTASLEEEVEYLRAVLANESGLSKVLGNIQNVKNVKLRSSFVSRKRSAEMDHDYTPSSKRRNIGSTAGVCLHVDNDTVSLEFCSKCSKMAQSEEENE